MSAPEIFAELRRHEDDEQVGIISMADYYDLSPAMAAETIPYLFVRTESGERVDLGTLTELLRALSMNQDFSQRRKVAR